MAPRLGERTGRPGTGLRLLSLQENDRDSTTPLPEVSAFLELGQGRVKLRRRMRGRDG